MQTTCTFLAAIEILHKIVMDNSYFSPNQTCQVEYDGTSAPLILLPSTHTQIYLLKEINDSIQKFNYPSISQPTMRKIWNTHFRDVAFSKNTNFITNRFQRYAVNRMLYFCFPANL